MKYEKENIVSGALVSPGYEETAEIIRKDNDSETLYENKNAVVGSVVEINNDVVLSQLVRIVSLIANTVDLTSLPQDQQDGIATAVTVLEAYPMMGDQMVAQDGKGRLEGAMIDNATFAANYASVTGGTVITDPYDGIVNTVDTVSNTKNERTTIIDEILSQSGETMGDLTPGDTAIITDYIDYAAKGIMVDTYGHTPTGRNIYDSLGLAHDQDMSIVMTAHINGGTIFDGSEFKVKYLSEV